MKKLKINLSIKCIGIDSIKKIYIKHILNAQSIVAMSLLVVLPFTIMSSPSIHPIEKNK